MDFCFKLRDEDIKYCAPSLQRAPGGDILGLYGDLKFSVALKL